MYTTGSYAGSHNPMHHVFTAQFHLTSVLRHVSRPSFIPSAWNRVSESYSASVSITDTMFHSGIYQHEVRKEEAVQMSLVFHALVYATARWQVAKRAWSERLNGQISEFIRLNVVHNKRRMHYAGPNFARRSRNVLWNFNRTSCPLDWTVATPLGPPPPTHACVALHGTDPHAMLFCPTATDHAAA